MPHRKDRRTRRRFLRSRQQRLRPRLTVEKATGTLWVGTSVGAIGGSVHLQTAQHLLPARKARPTNTSSPSASIARATNGSAPTPAGHPATGRQVEDPFPDADWPIIGSTPSSMTRKATSGSAPGRGSITSTSRRPSSRPTSRNSSTSGFYGLAMDGDGRICSVPRAASACTTASAGNPGPTRTDWSGETRQTRSQPSNTGLGTRSRHDLTTQVAGLPPQPQLRLFHRCRPDGAIWAGTWGGGVSRFDGKLVDQPQQSRRPGPATSFIPWCATTKAFSGSVPTRVFPATTARPGRPSPRPKGLSTSTFTPWQWRPNGDIWAGTKRGVVRIAPQ